MIVAPEARGKSPRENVENVESRLPESVIVIGVFWQEALGAVKAGYLIFCSFIARSFIMPSPTIYQPKMGTHG